MDLREGEEVSRLEIDFIGRAKELAKPYVKENNEIIRHRVNKWNHDNPEKLKECQTKYDQSDKGKAANKRKVEKYKNRIKELIKELSRQDLEDIAIFYSNRPEGMEIDHIIPISIGGKHHVSNLQYLTGSENSKKGSKLIHEMENESCSRYLTDSCEDGRT
jgi:5-methylcytosine-specific restriction endonuclease McrA